MTSANTSQRPKACATICDADDRAIFEPTDVDNRFALRVDELSSNDVLALEHAAATIRLRGENGTVIGE